MIAARNYPLLLLSQFLGAFGDNAILAVILGQLTFQQQHGLITQGQLGAANALYTTLLFIPYVLLAPLAGFFNDRFPKTRWLLGGNAIKLAGTLLAASSVHFGPFTQGLGYLIVGVGACIYSPAKYGILPEIVDRERLVKANGTVELLTLVAILTGNIGGARMIDALPVTACYAIILAIYTASLSLNLCMRRTPADPSVHLRRSLDEFVANFADLLRDPRLLRILCGTGLFWVCGAVTRMNFQPWGLNVVKLESNTQIALLGLWLSLGIMAGSVLAGQLHQVGDLRSVRPYGWTLAALIGLLGLVEAFSGAGYLHFTGLAPHSQPAATLSALAHSAGLAGGRWPVVLALILTGALAGLFLIPLNAALQNECNPVRLGKTIATQNFIDNLGMVGVGALVFVGNKAGFQASAIFLFFAAGLALTVTALKMPPRAPLSLHTIPESD
jgi:LPLT family lysophospholipid transporter-like MFS transporter